MFGSASSNDYFYSKWVEEFVEKKELEKFVRIVIDKTEDGRYKYGREDLEKKAKELLK